MKITICGSMRFAQEMMDVSKELAKQGHDVVLPQHTEKYVATPEMKNDYNLCIVNDVVMDHFKKVESGDAILVLNYPKRGLKNYIGGAVLMEMGIAYYLGKKIFILHDMPSDNDFSYVLEVKLTNPIILKGDLNKIR